MHYLLKIVSLDYLVRALKTICGAILDKSISYLTNFSNITSTGFILVYRLDFL